MTVKRLYILLALLVLVSALAPAVVAQDIAEVVGVVMVAPQFSLEILPLGVETDRMMVTQDYLWSVDRVSLYGFVEYSGEAGSWFTNHAATYQVLPWLSGRGEVGVDDGGVSFGKVGLQINLTPPGFQSLKVAPLFVSGTPEYKWELLLAWRTKPLGFQRLDVWFEGFIRTAREDADTYGQPQLWAAVPDSPWHFGAEVEVAGANRTLRVGIRRVF